MFIHNNLTYNLRPDFCIHDDNVGPLIIEIVHKKGKNIFISTHYKQPAGIYDALRDLVSFWQYKKREKHPWRSVTLSKVAGKTRNASHIPNLRNTLKIL